jgi:hypothetical protein
MKGSSVETYLEEEINLYELGQILTSAVTWKLEFHSHFLDCSWQDSSTMHEHMSVHLNT